MTFHNEEGTDIELTTYEQLITEYTEVISEELLNLFWGKSSIELKQIVEEVIPIYNDIEFYRGVKFGLLLSTITILESINSSLNYSPSIIRGMLIVRKLVEVVKKNID